MSDACAGIDGGKNEQGFKQEPRTIAMTIFGDLDLAVLDELPMGRRPVDTHLVPWERQPWVDRIWRRAAREIAAGGRVYVVCPRIDTDERGEQACRCRSRQNSIWKMRLLIREKL